MATQCRFEKMKKTPKFKIRKRNRCHLCGRPRGYLRRFDMCRLCFKEFAHRGEIPGVTKASW
ncbi:MAG: type Z 30S ribosomal protein S14 [Pseudomonadota bacterium]